MSELLLQNIFSVGVFVLIVIIVCVSRKEQSVKSKLYGLFLEAEKLNITGPEKLDMIAEYVYNNMSFGKKFMSKDTLKAYIQTVYNSIERYLASDEQEGPKEKDEKENNLELKN